MHDFDKELVKSKVLYLEDATALSMAFHKSLVKSKVCGKCATNLRQIN